MLKSGMSKDIKLQALQSRLHKLFCGIGCLGSIDNQTKGQ